MKQLLGGGEGAGAAAAGGTPDPIINPINRIESIASTYLVAGLLDAVEEELVLEGDGVLDHALDGVVGLPVLLVEVHRLVPEQRLLAGAQHLGHVHAVVEDLEVLHQLLGQVLGVQDAELREDARVRALQPQALLQQLHQLRGVARALVVRDELLQVVRVHDDVQAADGRQPELPHLDARHVHLLPRGDGVGLLRRVHRLAVLVQVDEAERQLGVVVDVGEEELSRLVVALVEEPLPDRLDVGHVGRRHEFLQLRQLPRLRQRVDVLRIHLHAHTQEREG